MPETTRIYLKNFASALSIQITKIFLKILLYQLLKTFLHQYIVNFPYPSFSSIRDMPLTSVML